MVDKHQHDRKVAATVHQAGAMDPMPSVETGYRVKHTGAPHSFRLQHTQNGVPFVGFIQIHRDLDRHAFSILQHPCEGHSGECRAEAKQVVREEIRE